MVELLELPDSAYELAVKRYTDLGEWFGRDESLLARNSPNIFPQGSFRLGTAIRPLGQDEEYDLDLACEIREGITSGNQTQENLKRLVGHEVETYRSARGIKNAKVEKHRCWRLHYQDQLNFHMDIVPCVPAGTSRQILIEASLREAGEEDLLKAAAARTTVLITDDRHHGYRTICDDWNISNPAGYGAWFEIRMNRQEMAILERAQVQAVPLYKRKTVLQRIVQLLKRHRDQMFGDDESKPISVIITTLAGRAYNGEKDTEAGLAGVLSRMGAFVRGSYPRVPNPVNPKEDFADRWSMSQYRTLKLEENFWLWLEQAQADFRLIGSRDDAEFIAEQAARKFGVSLNADELRKRLGLSVPVISVITAKSHELSGQPKPWSRIFK